MTNPARNPVQPDDRSALTPDVPPDVLAPAEPGDPDLGRLGRALGDRPDVRTVILAFFSPRTTGLSRKSSSTASTIGSTKERAKRSV